MGLMPDARDSSLKYVPPALLARAWRQQEWRQEQGIKKLPD